MELTGPQPSASPHSGSALDFSTSKVGFRCHANPSGTVKGDCATTCSPIQLATTFLEACGRSHRDGGDQKRLQLRLAGTRCVMMCPPPQIMEFLGRIDSPKLRLEEQSRDPLLVGTIQPAARQHNLKNRIIPRVIISRLEARPNERSAHCEKSVTF